MTARAALPGRRETETFELQHGKQNTQFTISVGRYRDHRIGEVFISGGKTGSDFEAVARDGAVLLSIALQYHVPMGVLRHAITREANGVASTIIGAVLDKLVEGE